MHISVLKKEVVEGLEPKNGEIFVDATGGNGGHSEAIISCAPEIKTVILDQDAEALDRIAKRLANYPGERKLVESNFRSIDEAVAKSGYKNADKVLFDLGLSSDQLENSGRGFSFQKNEPLLMTFSAKPNDSDLTAFEIANHWAEENIATVISAYGEEPRAKKIARAIVEARHRGEIKTSAELAEIVAKAAGKRGKIHPATKTFQAIRMAVNDEVRTLEEGIRKAFFLLNEKGRLAVISFHSIEDRIVKNFFKEKEKNGEGKIITKKPIRPSREESLENPRSRSAKLRIIEKIKNDN